MRHVSFPSLLLILLLHTATTGAQSPAQAPAPPGPVNVTAVLAKAGQFNSFIRLLENTQVGDQINTQLNNSNQGMTIFAPTDNAFSSLKSGTLNSLSDQQKVQLLQFHVLPSYITTTQFDTLSNPLRTQAGDSQSNGFPLNVTSAGNTVNVTTGVVNATVGSSVYTDGQLAVYPVDQVLLPMALFGPSPAPAPAPSAKAEKEVPTADTPSKGSDDTNANASGATVLSHRPFEVQFFGAIFFIAAFSVWL